MNKQVNRFIVRLETGEDVVFENHQFSEWVIKEGNLLVSRNGFIEHIYAAGYWKQIDIYYF